MDAVALGGSSAGRNARSVRRSRVVLAPRPWRLSMPARAGMATVTKNAAHRGEHEGNRKTIARGKPVLLAEPVVTNSCAFLFCTRGYGCDQRPASPRPLLEEGQRDYTLGRNRAAGMRAAVSTSLRAKRSNPALPQQRKLDCFVASLLVMTAAEHQVRAWTFAIYPFAEPPCVKSAPKLTAFATMDHKAMATSGEQTRHDKTDGKGDQGNERRGRCSRR
jgi:hypothetical protein